MRRVAVFVDAGYLFAQGSALLEGKKQPRTAITLHDAAALAALTQLACEKAGADLLRIYWYDGASYAGPSPEQARLASTDNVKLRLGFLNSAGKQKGVDSLIVTDMIDLARNRAMADAILLSGDEDVRVGVQVAQSYGVRVHLVGIEPCRASQSRQLLQEADTHTAWDRAHVAQMLTVRRPPPAGAAPAQPLPSSTEVSRSASATVAAGSKPAAATPHAAWAAAPTEATVADVTAVFEELVHETINQLEPMERLGIQELMALEQGVPRALDGRLLARARVRLDRDLDVKEKRQLRKTFLARLESRS